MTGMGNWHISKWGFGPLLKGTPAHQNMKWAYNLHHQIYCICVQYYQTNKMSEASYIQITYFFVTFALSKFSTFIWSVTKTCVNSYSSGTLILFALCWYVISWLCQFFLWWFYNYSCSMLLLLPMASHSRLHDLIAKGVNASILIDCKLDPMKQLTSIKSTCEKKSSTTNCISKCHLQFLSDYFIGITMNTYLVLCEEFTSP